MSLLTNSTLTLRSLKSLDSQSLHTVKSPCGEIPTYPQYHNDEQNRFAMTLVLDDVAMPEEPDDYLGAQVNLPI